MAPGAPVVTPAPFLPEGILYDLLAVSLTGVNVLRPVYGATGELVDFALDYLNPAAQRMTGLAERPGGTTRARFPDIFTNGVFALYRRVFETGEAGHYNFNYQADGFDNYFHVAARRSGEWLLVSFTDTADQDRTPVEVALREAQAAEQAARAETEAQRQRFYDLLMQLPAHVAVHEGPDQVFTLVNPGYQRLAPGRNLLGQPIREAWPELVSQGILHILDQVYQTGEPFVGTELPFQVDFTRTGRLEQVYFNAFFLPLRNAQGQLTGVLDFSYDVTEQVLARRQAKQLNQELEARVLARTQAALALQADLLAAAQRQANQQALFYQVFAQTPAAICIQRGPEHRYEYANQAYLDFFPGRSLIGQPVAEALPETVDSGVVALLDRVYETGETYFGEELPLLIAQPTEPPRPMYFTFTYQALRENGRVVGISTFAYNVAEQVRARQELEQREASFRTMADAAPAMLWVTDPEGYCTYLNAQWYLFTGQTEAEALGLGWTNAVHPDDAERAGQAFLQANARRELFHVRYRLRRHDGVYRWATDTGWPRFTEAGEYAGIVGTVIDVHEQQLAEQELQATNQQLTRTNVDLDTFVYTASHDLKAPITNIESIVLALRDTLPAAVGQDEMVAHLLDLLDQTVIRFQFTIGQLTDISRLQLAHVGPAEPVVLAQVVEDVRLDLVPVIAAAGTTLTVEVAAGLVVPFSPANLRSIVYNLLSNAIKYRAADRPSQVQLRAEQLPHAIQLTVQDNGLGMSEVQQRQLFGLFQRLHTHVEGTGVGLYITKRLVENAGGTITVHSQPDAGTTFTVTFPL